MRDWAKRRKGWPRRRGLGISGPFQSKGLGLEGLGFRVVEGFGVLEFEGFGFWGFRVEDFGVLEFEGLRFYGFRVKSFLGFRV